MTCPPTPRFRGGRPFRILQVTDTHYDLGDPGHAEVDALLGTALDALAPDLVAHTGDAVEPPRLAEGWAALTAPIARRGIPWCAVLGNHDLDPARGVGHRDVMGMVGALPGSLAQVGPETLRGGGTYALPILAPDGAGERFGVGLAYGRYSGGPNRRLLPESGVRVWDVAPDGRSAETFVWTAAHGRGAAQTFALRETVPC